MFPPDFQPMLASPAPEDLDALTYPVLVSPKLDGIRATMFGGVAYSRKLKPIRNEWVQVCLNTLPDGLDGELIVGSPTAPDVFKASTSGVMSKDGRPDFTFHIFDWHGASWQDPFGDTDVSDGFYSRLRAIAEAFHGEQRDGLPIIGVPHKIAYNAKDVLAMEAQWVGEGYEGVMIRAMNGPYKTGRSTTKEGYLLKLKRFHDDEALIVDFTERMHNANPQEIDERGYAKRSQAKDGKVPTGTLGALVCEYQGTTFEIGTGFTDADRQMIWNEREGYRGSLTKFKYQELTADGVPRFPVWMGFRDSCDT